MTDQTQSASEMGASNQSEAAPAETVEAIKAELEKTRAALKEANKEAAARRKRLEELEAEETKRKEAELSEMDKLKRILAEREAVLAKLERESLQRQVADKVGLPAWLAPRLQGEDAEAMEKDAKAILEQLPKQTAPKISPTSPGDGGKQGLTDAQRRAELFGQGQRAFDPEHARKHGGGVIYHGDKEA